jgi:hypothetical protein
LKNKTIANKKVVLSGSSFPGRLWRSKIATFLTQDKKQEPSLGIRLIPELPSTGGKSNVDREIQAQVEAATFSSTPSSLIMEHMCNSLLLGTALLEREPR